VGRKGRRNNRIYYVNMGKGKKGSSVDVDQKKKQYRSILWERTDSGVVPSWWLSLEEATY